MRTVAMVFTALGISLQATLILAGQQPLAQTNDPNLNRCIHKMRALGWHWQPISQTSSVTLVDDELRISGKITPDTLRQFRSIDKRNVKTVVLHSGGGDIDVGKEIAEEIHLLGWNTKIPQFGLCGSICTGMFQAGKERTMHQQSVLMYHNAKVEALPNSNPLFARANGAASKVATHVGIGYLERWGLSPRLRQDIMKTPSESFHCLNANEARGYNASTLVEKATRPIVPIQPPVENNGGLLDGVTTETGAQTVE